MTSDVKHLFHEPVGHLYVCFGKVCIQVLCFLVYGSYLFISAFAAYALVLYHPPPPKKITAKTKVFFPVSS